MKNLLLLFRSPACCAAAGALSLQSRESLTRNRRERKKRLGKRKKNLERKKSPKRTLSPGSVGQRREQHALLGVERDNLVGVLRLELVVPLGEQGGDLGLGGVGAGLGLSESFFFFLKRVGVSRESFCLLLLFFSAKREQNRTAVASKQAKKRGYSRGLAARPPVFSFLSLPLSKSSQL